MDGGTVIGIDATNIRGGGGSTHLIELLNALNPRELGIQKVVIWAGALTVSLLPVKSWLTVVNPKMLNKGLFSRTVWQILFLSKCAEDYGCDVLYVPGGSYSGSFKPVVTMSQNLLPFESAEFIRFGLSTITLRFLLLRYAQSKAFQKSAGVIFLTDYARKVVEKKTGQLSNTALIPHGISSIFFREPKLQFSYDRRNDADAIRVLYVSIVNQYKHQWHVIEAIAHLREKYGYSIELTLVGPSFPAARHKLDSQIAISDSERKWVKYTGAVSHTELVDCYSNADLGIFASSCETLPIILLEKMASGLPIACSNKGPMPDVLGDAGLYFDPENSEEIASSIYDLINSKDLRTSLAWKSYEKAKLYSWTKCSFDTFRFLSKVSLKK
jgi:glycosyltransferase involved in cell wall biosynthesis